MKENELTEAIIGSAIEIHRAFGPGLIECIYEDALAMELGFRGIGYERQKPVPLNYKGHPLGAHLKLDLQVEGRVIVELKSVERLLPVHEAQLLTYLRLTSVQVGLLINFNVSRLATGVKRRVNNFQDSAPRRLRGVSS